MKFIRKRKTYWQPTVCNECSGKIIMGNHYIRNGLGAIQYTAHEACTPEIIFQKFGVIDNYDLQAK